MQIADQKPTQRAIIAIFPSPMHNLPAAKGTKSTLIIAFTNSFNIFVG